MGKNIFGQTLPNQNKFQWSACVGQTLQHWPNHQTFGANTSNDWQIFLIHFDCQMCCRQFAFQNSNVFPARWCKVRLNVFHVHTRMFKSEVSWVLNGRRSKSGAGGGQSPGLRHTWPFGLFTLVYAVAKISWHCAMPTIKKKNNNLLTNYQLDTPCWHPDFFHGIGARKGQWTTKLPWYSTSKIWLQ